MQKTGWAKWSARVLPLLCIAASLFTRPLYEDVDNHGVATVLSGAFGAGNGCQYTHVLLNLLMKGLSFLLPSADCWSLTGRIGIALAFCLLCRIARGSRPGGAAPALTGCWALFFSLPFCLWTLNYGIQAVFFSGTGWLALSAGEKAGDRRLSRVGLAFWALGALWRLNVSLVFLPFMLLDFLCGLGEPAAETKSRAMRVWLPVALCTAVLSGVQFAADRRPDAAEGLRYDRARVLLEDYPTKDWPEIEAAARSAGFTQTEYDMARLWFLADTDRFDTEALETMAALGSTSQYEWNLRGLAAAAYDLLHFFDDEAKENIVWAAGLLLMTALAAVSCASRPRRIQALLILPGAAAVVLVFLIVGRAPLRLVHIAFMAALFSQSDLLIRSGSAPLPARRRVLLPLCSVLGAALLLSSLHSLLGAGFRAPQFALAARRSAETDGGAQPAPDPGFLLWEDWTGGVARPLMAEGRLPDEALLRRNLPAGDWVYGQPCFMGALSAWGAENPARLLIDSETAFLVADDPEYLRLVGVFLSGNTGLDVRAEPAGERGGHACFRLRSAP